MTRLGFTLAFSLALTATSSFGKPAEEAKGKDYTKTPLAEIGVHPVTPKKDAKTGFLVAGKNATPLIRKLTEINGRTIADLEKDMRPGAGGEVGSGSGFLGATEKLLDVLAMDNAFVVDKLGLTHQDIARPLHIAAAIGMTDRFNDAGVTFRYRGQSLHVKMICYKGSQLSPFLDNTSTFCDAIVKDLATGKTLKYSPLVPHMIERYGFYEGKGTPYRVEPAEVLEVFTFLKGMAKKVD